MALFAKFIFSGSSPTETGGNELVPMDDFCRLLWLGRPSFLAARWPASYSTNEKNKKNYVGFILPKNTDPSVSSIYWLLSQCIPTLIHLNPSKSLLFQLYSKNDSGWPTVIFMWHRIHFTKYSISYFLDNTISFKIPNFFSFKSQTQGCHSFRENSIQA